MRKLGKCIVHRLCNLDELEAFSRKGDAVMHSDRIQDSVRIIFVPLWVHRCRAV